MCLISEHIQIHDTRVPRLFEINRKSTFVIVFRVQLLENARTHISLEYGLRSMHRLSMNYKKNTFTPAHPKRAIRIRFSSLYMLNERLGFEIGFHFHQMTTKGDVSLNYCPWAVEVFRRRVRLTLLVLFAMN